MKRHENTIGIIPQIAILFAIGIFATGLIVFFSQQVRSDMKVRVQTEEKSRAIAGEVKESVNEYPAHDWFIRYWYENAEDMDIEYDVDYYKGSETQKKVDALAEKYPDVQLKYATEKDLEAMDPADQKASAEVVYSWLLTRVNQMKKVYDIDYLFCVIPYDSFKKQFFLFSAAYPGAVRGTNYSEAYPLGHRVEIIDNSQRKAMLAALNDEDYIASAGDFVDYYAYLGKMGDYPLLTGVTYDVSGLVSEIGSQTKWSTFITVVYQMLLAIICMILLFRYVIRPLREVTLNIRRYADTKDSETARSNLEKIVTSNEIGQLADDVSDLSLEMDNYLDEIRDITAEKERIGAELSVATRIQESMLPSIFPAFPEREEFEIYASMEPAKEVGGDFFDFFLVDDDHICLVIADVSGKGVPAALQMMASMIIIDNKAKIGISPAQIMEETNNAICANNREEMFVTAWLGILELSTGRLMASNAGHEYPILKSPDGNFELYKDKHAFVLGGMEDVSYGEYEIIMEPGSKIFVYTDGVAEATNADKELFGTDRMLDAVNMDPDADPEQILKNVHESVDRFVGEAEQFDDLTMLCMEYKGPHKDEE